MTRGDRTDYSKKHPNETINPSIEAALDKKKVNGRVSCHDAHEIAKALSVSPMEVGKNMDLLNLRIEKCQLGLFGYTPNKRAVKPLKAIEPDLEDAITSGEEKGKLPCNTAFIIAEKMNISKMKVAGAAETMKKRISQCQLGAF